MSRSSKVSMCDARGPRQSDDGSAVTVVLWVAVGIVVVVLVAGAVFAIASGKAEPTSYGFNAPALKSGLAKAGISAPDLSEPVDASKVSFSGSKPLDAEFTDEELSAMLNAVFVTTRIPITNLAVKLHAGSTVDASGEGQYHGKWYSGWIKGPADAAGNTVTSSGSTGYGVASVPVPLAGYKDQVTQFALDIINAHLAIVSGLKITKIEVSDGKVRVVGVVPAKMVVNK